MSVWDPVITFRFDHTGEQAAGAEWVSPDVYRVPPDEVLEIFRVEIKPAVNPTTNTIRKLRYVTLMIDGNEYPLRINSVMVPYDVATYPGVAVDLGIPYLWRPITGRIPAPHEGTCPKVARGQTLTVKTVADETLTESYSIILKAARVRGASKLVEVVGTSVVDVSFTLDRDVYTKAPVVVGLETFDELPGGLKQEKPQIFPWLTYARNRKATTPNQWYDFDYTAGAVDWDWQNLSWNLVNKEKAFLVNALGVIPHANAKALRLYVEGRITNPEFSIKPMPDVNEFPPAMFYEVATNDTLKRIGPRFLVKPFLFHGVKGGIQVIDSGTSIPANGVEVHVYGTQFILR